MTLPFWRFGRPAMADDNFDAWNPGLESEIPTALFEKITLYRSGNSLVTYRDAKEAADYCGLKPRDMVELTVPRLVIHELLIRVTGDLNVPDGPNYAELGINLRGMADTILRKHVAPQMVALEARFGALRADVERQLGVILDRDLFKDPPESARRTGFLARFAIKPAPPPRSDPTIALLSRWRAVVQDGTDPLEAACLGGLQTIIGGMLRQRGRLMADRSLLVKLTTRLVCNTYGSQQIGRWIKPIISSAAAAEDYRVLPFQAKPMVLNVKGASAAGKSTIRPLQRDLAERLGVSWQDFALISPDYWRKFLLDYESLGDDYKYAAMLTGEELEIIDKKLDSYMAAKDMRGQVPHLLIDRFRFDSFTAHAQKNAGGNLLSRFGDRVFMFFMITPPAETVERAWKRGQKTGRYKAVDDLLFHNIEAYTGMPQLFLSWVNKTPQRVHFEFLDNSVPLGERPRTVAFGWNGQVTILDPVAMRQMNRYQNVNIDARKADDVLLPNEPTGDILADCIHAVPHVTFAEAATLRVMGQTEDGDITYEVDGFFDAIGVSCDKRPAGKRPEVDFEHEQQFTLGAWGKT